MESVSLQPGENVRFALGKVICPGVDELCKQIDSGLEIEGQVVFLSDYGNVRGHFAIVQVKGIGVPLIVPVKSLQLVKRTGLAPEQMAISKDKLVR